MNSDDLELISQLRTIAHEVEALEERNAKLEVEVERLRRLEELTWRAGYGEAIRRAAAGEDLDEQTAWESTSLYRAALKGGG